MVSALSFFALGLLVAGTGVLAVLTWRVRQEIIPTFQAFADLQASLQPLTSEVAASQRATRSRLDRLRHPDSRSQQG